MTVAVARDYVHVAGELRPDLGQLWPPMPVDMEYGLASVRSVNGDSEACLCEAMEVDTKSPKVIDLKARLEKVSQTTTVEPSMELAQPTREATYVRTDLGNTNYFIEHHKDDFRFDHTRNQWLVWREHRWEPDALTRVVDAVQTDAETRLRRAVLGIDPQEDFDTRDKYVKWLLQSQQRSRIDAVVHLAKSREAIAVATAQGWDANPWLLGAPNGVVDLRTGEFRPGRQNDHITKHLGARFDSQATCPRFLEFLEEVFDGDKALVTFVRRAFGYTMTGSVSEDCWFGCYGSGRNGK